MISNPKHGWCDFNIDGFSGQASYITDVPIDLLDAFINFWTVHPSLAVYFDEEGSSFTLVINPYSVYIIEEKEIDNLIYINNNIENLTLELINDIESDFDNWVNFLLEDNVKEKRNELTDKLNQLKAIVVERNIKENPCISDDQER